MTITYPRIEKMMAGYINMDAYEITGSSELKDQVAYFTSRVSPKALRELVDELARFESEHADRLTESFETTFDYGADIQDACQFFELVRAVVRTKIGEKKSTIVRDSIADKSFLVKNTERLISFYNSISDQELNKITEIQMKEIFVKFLTEYSLKKSFDECATNPFLDSSDYKNLNIILKFTSNSADCSNQKKHTLDTDILKGITLRTKKFKPVLKLENKTYLLPQPKKETNQ